MKERYEDDLSTHPDLNPDLWSKAGLSGGPNRNRIYEISNTTIKNLRMTRSVSTIGCSQSIPSTQSSKFIALLDQEVKEYLVHLNEKHEQLSVNFKELCQIVMDMRSQISGTCAPSYWPHVSRDDQPPPSPPVPPLL